VHRTVKSFVLRSGRLSHRQKAALSLHLPEYALPGPNVVWDFAEIFGRHKETIVEIGFGMGGSLIAMAEESPETNFIGIEVHLPGIGALAAQLHEKNLHNVRIASFDAVEVFKTCIPDSSLAGVQIFFPDPWPKKRHHKRRLIQPEFVRLVVSKLKENGVLHCATDWEDYARHMLSVLNAENLLRNSNEAQSYSSKPETRPLTKFEQRGKRLGHKVWDLIFDRLA
jgi:tRNA (guanine-N7-)-methyltransferase